MEVYYNDESLASLTANDVEKMDDKTLIEVAQLQKDALNNTHPLNKQKQQTELTEVLCE